MQIKDVEKLKAWLLIKLEPLCDADPAALAKYVVALLRKDKPKSALKELCIDQLEVFLSKETISFVDRLFRCLDSESYLTGHDPPLEATPTATPPSSSVPSGKVQHTKAALPKAQAKPQTAKSHSVGTRDGAQSSPLAGSSSTDRSGGSLGEKGPGKMGGDRRHADDPRSREVDEDDRDFRRSGIRGGRSTEGSVRGTRGGVTVSREPDSSTGGGQRGLETVGDKARATMVSTGGDLRGKRRRGEGEGVSSTGGRPGERNVRRVVKDRPWPEERSRPVRRPWQHRSRSRSRSSSSSTDSSSSTSGGHGYSRKRSRQEWNERDLPSRIPVGGSVEGGGGKSGEGTDDGESQKDGNEGKRQRCKDYDEKGFCMLGDQCPFDHGVDPVVIGNNIPHAYPPPPSMVGIPSLTLTKPGFMVPPGRASPTESTTDGYNPEEPALTATSTAPSSAPSFLPAPGLLNPTPLLPRPFPPPHLHPSHPHPHLQGVPGLPPLPPVGPFPPPPIPPPITSTSHHFPPAPLQPSYWPCPPVHTPFPSTPRQPSDTLIVRKIPRESNTITKLSGHFEKFGTIVNLTVWYGGDPEGALVQFSTPFEARKAHDSAEAVLNNRFIKIYYLRKDTSYQTPQLPRESTLGTLTGMAVSSICGPPQTLPQDSLGDHTHLLTPPTTTAPSIPHHTPTSHQTTPSQSSKVSSPHTYVGPSPATHPTSAIQRKRKTTETTESKEMMRKRLELQKKTGELLQKQIDQQKVLISKLEKGGRQMSAEERKKIMKTLKSLSASIVKLKNMASEAMEARLKSKQTQPSPPSPSSPTPPSPSPTSPSLTEKAQALRREAHQLGLISSPSQPLSQTTPTSKWTGSHVTGSGGGQMKDLRSVLNQKHKSLLVINAINRDQLTAHFDTFGGLVKVEMDPEDNKNLIFSFRNTHLAQKAAKHSSSVNGKPLIMKWYTAKSIPSPYSHTPHFAPSPAAPPPPSSLPLSTTSSTITLMSTDNNEQVTTPTLATPTLTKLDPEELHLVEDDEDEESEERSWRR